MKFPKPVSVKKKRKPIRQIGKRTQKRLKDHGSESEIHKLIWEQREHICEVCGLFILQPLPWCFAHKLPKGMFKKYRYMPENYALVCDTKCHGIIDKIYQGDKRVELIQYLDSLLDKK